MTAQLILTVIGDDRPGLVESLATVVAAHEASWLESSLAHLAGKFAGIVRVSVPEPAVAGLREALAALPGLRVSADEAGGSGNAGNGERRRLKLALVGHDRIGIVREVSQVLARHAVNVEEFSTHTASAPMSADLLFHASAELTAAPTLDALALIDDLERLSNDLMVDINLDETIRR